jgi:2-polyprenyl-6-methoxyphenol hydroxylase-like FAD-dependent oxidoreductase
MDKIATTTAEVPVLVVGGGPTGLITSLLLARNGIQSMLVERHPGTSVLPRATGVNVRTMEILRSLGLEDEVLSKSPDTRGMDYIAEMDVLGGPVVDRTPYPNAIDPDAPGAPSPSPFCFISQDELEPLLLAELWSRPEVTVAFNTQLTGFRQDEAGITATLLPRDGGQQRDIRAAYLVAADGAESTVRDMLGIAMRGHGHLSRSLNILFEADLQSAARGRFTLLHFVNRPDPLGRGVFRNMDGTGRRWSLFTNWFAGATPERCADVICDYAGDPDLRVDVRQFGEWERATLLADTFRSGRVFLAGDAAHRVTPTGGMGMNTAIQSAHNLAWKVAAVLRGWAGPALLDSYEIERRPIAQRTVDLSYELFGQHPRRAGKLLGLILGAAYAAGAVISDGTPPPAPSDPIAEYMPTARPGHRAPHHWLTVEGRRVSTLDLFDGRFVLLTRSEAWSDAARALSSELDVPLSAHVIGDGRWAELYGVGSRGAVLVRPDGYVAWRTPHDTAKDALRDALIHVLARSQSADVKTPATSEMVEV